MESKPPTLTTTAPAATRRTGLWTGVAKMALGVALLAALVYWGQIDFRSLARLAGDLPVLAGCLAILLLTLPVAALRWSILLRALGAPISFVNVLHFVCIGMLTNTFLLGSVGGDAVRGLYAWRAVGGAGGRVAISLLADRLFGLFAVLLLCSAFSLFNWRRMLEVPALAALGISTVVAAAACIAGLAALLGAPRLVAWLETSLARWPSIADALRRSRELLMRLRASPLTLLGALMTALIIQFLIVFAVALLADALNIGSLGAMDFLLAVPLTLAVNALPLTPGGIGIGEAAFDQICRWLEPVPTGAAYSSIFFACRIILALTGLPGLISLVVYRNTARSEANG